LKKPRYSETLIFKILKEAEAGTPVPDLCHTYGMSSASFYKWRAKYGGMEASDMAKLKELEEENLRLKKMYADAKMDNEILKETAQHGPGRHHPETEAAADSLSLLPGAALNGGITDSRVSAPSSWNWTQNASATQFGATSALVSIILDFLFNMALKHTQAAQTTLKSYLQRMRHMTQWIKN
jgi:putative transposase